MVRKSKQPIRELVAVGPGSTIKAPPGEAARIAAVKEWKVVGPGSTIKGDPDVVNQLRHVERIVPLDFPP